MTCIALFARACQYLGLFSARAADQASRNLNSARFWVNRNSCDERSEEQQGVSRLMLLARRVATRCGSAYLPLLVVPLLLIIVVIRRARHGLQLPGQSLASDLAVVSEDGGPSTRQRETARSEEMLTTGI